jgi:hypothetical protein
MRSEHLEQDPLARLVPLLDAGEEVAWVPTWEGRYAVTSLGRVFSVARTRPKELAGDQPHGDVRRAVTFRDKQRGVNLHVLIAKLVLAAFDPMPGVFGEGFPFVARHRDGNPARDLLENLVWGLPKANRADRILHERAEALAAEGRDASEISEILALTPQEAVDILRRRNALPPEKATASLEGLPAMSGEQFRWIGGWEGQYAVSNRARVFSFKGRGARELVPQLSHTNRGDHRYGFSLSRDGVLQNIRRSVLVAEAFLGPRPSAGHVVRHVNSDPLDDHATNLAWGTQAENVEDMVDAGRMLHGQAHPGSKLSDHETQEIRARYLAGREGRGPRETMDTLARAYGVSRGQIHNIVSGKQRNEDGRRRDGPGKARGDRHYNAKVTESEVRSIKQIARDMRAEGQHPTPARVRDAMHDAGLRAVELHVIKPILNGRTWAHVPDDADEVVPDEG